MLHTFLLFVCRPASPQLCAFCAHLCSYPHDPSLGPECASCSLLTPVSSWLPSPAQRLPPLPLPPPLGPVASRLLQSLPLHLSCCTHGPAARCLPSPCATKCLVTLCTSRACSTLLAFRNCLLLLPFREVLLLRRSSLKVILVPSMFRSSFHLSFC